MAFLMDRAPWYLAGPLIGAIVVLLLWVSTATFMVTAIAAAHAIAWLLGAGS
jgi:hypothetical protein